MNTAILLIILWLALAACSLACTLAYDGDTLTRRKLLIGITLGPVATIIAALVLLVAAIGGRR